jgi:hypothetical protein
VGSSGGSFASMTIAEVGWLGGDNKWERERRATIDMQRWRYELENGRAPPQTAVRREKLRRLASIDGGAM